MNPLVAIVMGSRSDLDVMSAARETLLLSTEAAVQRVDDRHCAATQGREPCWIAGSSCTAYPSTRAARTPGAARLVGFSKAAE